MSDTPETDQQSIRPETAAMFGGEPVVTAAFSKRLERRANDAEAKVKRVLARLIKAREFTMDMRAYQELQEAINELQQ